MDVTTLVDIGFAFGGLLGAGLIVYGAWLSLTVHEVKLAKGTQDENQHEVVVREPRPRIRAGTGERELRSSRGSV